MELVVMNVTEIQRQSSFLQKEAIGYLKSINKGQIVLDEYNRGFVNGWVTKGLKEKGLNSEIEMEWPPKINLPEGSEVKIGDTIRKLYKKLQDEGQIR